VPCVLILINLAKMRRDTSRPDDGINEPFSSIGLILSILESWLAGMQRVLDGCSVKENEALTVQDS